MADISNNPFIDHTASVAARYPSIETVGSPPPQPQYTGWVQPTQSSYGQPIQQQYQQQLQYQQQPQPQPISTYSQRSYQTGYQASPALGQPSQSGFYQQSQQQLPQPTGYNIGYGQQPQQQQSFTGYQPQPQSQPPLVYVQQQQSQPTSYGGYQPQAYGGNASLTQFDPYANLGQSFGQQPQQSGSPSTFPNAQTPSSGGGGPPGQEHPRQYIQSHKAELESWDTVSWRQCLNSFDVLMEAWKQRQLTVEARIKVYGGTPSAASGFFGGQPGYGYSGYGGYNPQAQETERLNGVLKEAQSNVDTIAAAKFQMTEVQSSYRHSSDAASKRRVREATNAALQGLPDWPAPNF